MNFDPSAFVANPGLIDALEKRATTISCSEDRILFRQGDAPGGLYILQNGEVALTMASSAGEALLSTNAIPGSLLGLPGVIGNEPYSLTAVARRGATLSFIKREDFVDFMQSNPHLSLPILLVLADEVRSARNALRNA